MINLRFLYLRRKLQKAKHVDALKRVNHKEQRSPAQIEKYIKDYSILPGSSDYYGNGIPWAGYFAGD